LWFCPEFWWWDRRVSLFSFMAFILLPNKLTSSV
jgi:hypothetical protein